MSRPTPENEPFDAGKFFGILLDSTHLVVYLKDLEGKYLYVNRRYAEVAGVAADLIIGKVDADLFPPETAALFKSQDAEVLAHNGPLEFEETLPLPGGSLSFVTEKFPLKDPQGKVIGVGGFCTEVTARAVREKKRRAEAKQRYQRLLEGLHQNYFFYTHDAAGVFTHLSPSVSEALGYTPEEFKTHYSEFMTDCPGNQGVHEKTKLCLQGVAVLPYRVELYAKDRSIHTLEVSEFPVRDSEGNITGVEGIARDITAHTNALETLRQSEERFRLLFAKSVDGILAANLESGEIVLCNDAMSSMLGYSGQELLGSKLNDLHLRLDGSQPLEQLIQLSDRAAASPTRMRAIRKDGFKIWVDVKSSRMGIDGQPCVIGFYRDCTARKMAEEALKLGSERFRAIFVNSSDGILAADMETMKFNMANPKICSMLGYSERELYGMGVDKIHPEEDLTLVVDVFQKQASGKMGASPPLRVLRKDGSVFWAEITTSAITLEGRPHSLGFFRDVSNRTEAGNS